MATKTNTILAGDIGGTKSYIALFEEDNGTLELQRAERFHSNAFTSLGTILREFLGENKTPIAAAGFGVPGVVHKGRVKPTNISWAVDAGELAAEFKIPHVEILNDLAANAYGISELQPEDFLTLHPGEAGATGNRCVISPGTGLGQAGLFWDGKKHRVWACEGGHTDFAPRTEIEMALLDYLIKQFGHVSYERVVSGMGIENIYKFLRDTGRGTELPLVIAEMQTQDPGATISKHALAGSCPMCAQTLEIFVSCLGAEAGNFALKTMATGGVFLGGGIPGKILPKIKSAAFIHAFFDKGRMNTLMERIPVKIVLNDQAALLGAARYAVDAVA